MINKEWRPTKESHVKLLIKSYFFSRNTREVRSRDIIPLIWHLFCNGRLIFLAAGGSFIMAIWDASRSIFSYLWSSCLFKKGKVQIEYYSTKESVLFWIISTKGLGSKSKSSCLNKSFLIWPESIPFVSRFPWSSDFRKPVKIYKKKIMLVTEMGDISSV